MTDRISRFSGTKFMTSSPPVGFGVRFSVADNKTVFTTIVFDESKEGGKGILHGGAIAAVLDEAMGVAAYENGQAGYTVTMTYNYQSHIPIGHEIRIRAWVEAIVERKIFTACDAQLPDDTIAVIGSGIFVASKKLQKQLDNHPYEPKDE